MAKSARHWLAHFLTYPRATYAIRNFHMLPINVKQTCYYLHKIHWNSPIIIALKIHSTQEPTYLSISIYCMFGRFNGGRRQITQQQQAKRKQNKHSHSIRTLKKTCSTANYRRKKTVKSLCGQVGVFGSFVGCDSLRCAVLLLLLLFRQFACFEEHTKIHTMWIRIFVFFPVFSAVNYYDLANCCVHKVQLAANNVCSIFRQLTNPPQLYCSFI